MTIAYVVETSVPPPGRGGSERAGAIEMAPRSPPARPPAS